MVSSAEAEYELRLLADVLTRLVKAGSTSTGVPHFQPARLRPWLVECCSKQIAQRR